MKAIQAIMKSLSWVVGIEQHGTFCGPRSDSDLLFNVESYGLPSDHRGHNWYRLALLNRSGAFLANHCASVPS